MDKYIGIPFKEHGRDINGWDCYGLIYYILKKEFNINIPSYVDNYGSIEDYRQLSKLILKEKKKWNCKSF